MAGVENQPNIPAHWELAYTAKIASYMTQQFRTAVGWEADGAKHAIPRNIGIETLCEADWMVNVLACAYKNKIVLQNIDAIRLSEKGNRESTFRQAPENASDDASVADPLREITDPAVIVDQSDVVLIWYLPDGVSQANQMLLWKNVENLTHPLRVGLANGQHSNWRTNEQLFTMTAETKGAMNMSPAWFQQARHGGYAVPEISAAIKSEDAKQWLGSVRDQAAILSGALSIMHPEMYAKALEVMVNLGQFADETEDAAMQNILAQWPSVYNVATILVNRVSPFHVDRFGRPQSLDMLVTFGTYSKLYFFLPTLGIVLKYHPGTVLALSGQMIEHGVGRPDGDRAVLAWYMRDDVHEFMNVSRSHFVRYADFERL